MIDMIRAVLLIAFMSLVFTACQETAATKRYEKDIVAAKEGLNRTLTVYSMDGKVIKTYSGKFDIEYTDGEKVKFDIDGRRVILYNALVICEETGVN